MRQILVCLLAPLLAGPGFSQDSGDDDGLWEDADLSVWERESWGEVVVLLAPGFDGGAREADAETLLYEVSLGGSAERILQSGARIGAAAALRVQRDHPERPGFAGALTEGAGLPTGAFSGLGSEEKPDVGPRGALETAYLYFRNGYGEWVVGRDLGIAARVHTGNVSVFTHANSTQSRLDPSGIALARTRHDLTGPSAKVSYSSARILGVRAGASYTPQTEGRGLDRAVERGPELSHAVEFGLDATRQLRQSDLKLSAGLAWSTAEIDDSSGEFHKDRVETWSAGAEVASNRVRFGVSWIDSDEGTQAGDYTAWSAQTAVVFGDWTMSLERSDAEADLTALSGKGFSFGVARDFGDRLRVAAGYQHQELSVPRRAAFASTEVPNDRDGIVVEITLSK